MYHFVVLFRFLSISPFTYRIVYIQKKKLDPKAEGKQKIPNSIVSGLSEIDILAPMTPLEPSGVIYY